MSADSVDDLEYAEELLLLRNSAEELGYCRPTCGYMDALEHVVKAGAEVIAPESIDEADDACSDTTCGCPCGHPGSALAR